MRARWTVWLVAGALGMGCSQQLSSGNSPRLDRLKPPPALNPDSAIPVGGTLLTEVRSPSGGVTDLSRTPYNAGQRMVTASNGHAEVLGPPRDTHTMFSGPSGHTLNVLVRQQEDVGDVPTGSRSTRFIQNK
jgi:hypothetical protein